MRREPLLKKATWTALAGAALAVLVAAGAPISPDLRAALIALIGAAAPVAVAVWGRRDVTPLADPRDNQGRPLTPDEQDY